MTPSLRLLLEDFLGLMREEGELDLFLPLLMSAMGHEVVYRAQKGPRQYGVDICSVGRDEDGRRKLFLWLVKCGDIGRQDWDTGPQAIRQSINDVSDVYLRSHVAPQHASLPKKLLIVTNGDFKAALTQSIATYLTDWCPRSGVDAEMVNGSTLASWTERFLLDEHILPARDRALLRRMLANVSSPDICINVGRTLFDGLVESAKVTAKSKGARTKRQLTALRGIRTALSVLQVWGQNERNLLAPYRLAEYAVLRVWAGLHDQVNQSDGNIAREFAHLVFQLTAVADAYHAVMQPYYVTQDALAHQLPDSLLVGEKAFSELGRLGLQGVIWAFYAVESDDVIAHEFAGAYIKRVETLLESHSCTCSPPYDRHSTDIHVALLLLLIGNRVDAAREWVEQLAVRLAFVSKNQKYWPINAPFEDALAIRHGFEDVSHDFMSTSTLLPMLLLWTAALEMPSVYKFIREEIIPAVPRTTPNIWSSDVGYDGVVANPNALYGHGVGEGMLEIPADPLEFLTNMAKPLPGVQSIEDAAWYAHRVSYIPLLAALHWGLQVPREMLAKHVVARRSR